MNAYAEWQRLSNRRRGLERRWEKYAGYTLPRLYTPEHWNEDSDELSHDWQSVGAQAVNHVVNKLMLSLFAPSRPFMRLKANPEWLQKLPENVTPAQVEEALANAERSAVEELDAIPGARAKFYTVLANLVTLGNVCLFLPKKRQNAPRVFGVRNYVVRRTGDGKVKCLIIRECLKFDELEEKVQAEVQTRSHNRYKPDSAVQYFRLIMRQENGSYKMEQWVDKEKLSSSFDGNWSEEDMPYRVLVWNIKDGNHYGTGLVEDYAGDFGGLSSLSEAQVKGAILASEFRWLVNPMGMTSIEDFEQSENGAALAGQEGDINLVANSKPGDLQVITTIGQDYIQRIGRGFLLGSAATRNAERVTAEEIRMQAQELETSFGGTYSQIAVDLQIPTARWLLKHINLSLKGTQLKMTILTGLDALSRMGDLDSLRAALADCASFAQISQYIPEVDRASVVSTIFTGHGLNAAKYVKSAEVMEQERKEAEAAQTQQEINKAAIPAGVDAATGTDQ